MGSQEILKITFLYPNSSFPWFTSQTKDENLDSSCELYQEHKEEISASPKHDSLPQPTTTQRSTFKVLETTKITKLGLLFLPPLFFNRSFTTSKSKNKFIFLTPEKRFATAELKGGFANYYANNKLSLSSRYNIKYQISNFGSENLLNLDFPEMSWVASHVEP